VILATDGDFNVGLKTEDELNEMISMHRQSGIYLTCLGVGMGNYKDSKIQTLARRGNGNFAYIDNFNEGQKILMKEFAQTLYAVADDVYMNVAFNPRHVKEYRLLGFDNRVGAIADTLAEVEGGEIGSGYSMMGIFEIEPVHPLQKTDSIVNIPDTFATIRLNYRHTNDTNTHSFSYHSPYDFLHFEKIEKHYRFSAAVAIFGSLLRSSSFVKTMDWNSLVLLATLSYDENDILQKEFVTLVTQARELYTRGKKKKREKNE
jgi:Ca-activated chloride channel family protein